MELEGFLIYIGKFHAPPEYLVQIFNIPRVVKCLGPGQIFCQMAADGEFFSNAWGCPGGMVKVGIERDIMLGFGRFVKH